MTKQESYQNQNHQVSKLVFLHRKYKMKMQTEDKFCTEIDDLVMQNKSSGFNDEIFYMKTIFPTTACGTSMILLGTLLSWKAGLQKAYEKLLFQSLGRVRQDLL